MLIQFSSWTLDDPNLKDEMAMICSVLDEAGIEYEMNRVSTTIEGDWETLMPVIRKCHLKLREKHIRVLTNISVDDDD